MLIRPCPEIFFGAVNEDGQPLTLLQGEREGAVDTDHAAVVGVGVVIGHRSLAAAGDGEAVDLVAAVVRDVARRDRIAARVIDGQRVVAAGRVDHQARGDRAERNGERFVAVRQRADAGRDDELLAQIGDFQIRAVELDRQVVVEAGAVAVGDRERAVDERGGEIAARPEHAHVVASRAAGVSQSLVEHAHRDGRSFGFAGERSGRRAGRGVLDQREDVDGAGVVGRIDRERARGVDRNVAVDLNLFVNARGRHVERQAARSGERRRLRKREQRIVERADVRADRDRAAVRIADCERTCRDGVEFGV